METATALTGWSARQQICPGKRVNRKEYPDLSASPRGEAGGQRLRSFKSVPPFLSDDAFRPSLGWWAGGDLVGKLRSLRLHRVSPSMLP